MDSSQQIHEVVVGVDALPESGPALEWAATEAERLGCPLRMVHAVDTGTATLSCRASAGATELIMQAGRDLLAEAAAQVASAHPGLDAAAAVTAADPAAAILDASGPHTLAVVGSRGRGGFASLLLGSVSLRVAAHAECPVVVVHAPSQPGEGLGVLVGVLGEEDVPVVRFALEAAVRRGAPVRALHAWSAVSDAGHMVPMVDSLDEEEREHARLLHRTVAAAREGLPEDLPGGRVAADVVSGTAAAALVEASAHASLLVVGAPRRARVGRLGQHLGSVVHAVLHHAHCPVAVVPVG
ncbi:universal stress protein [Streptacidiphilus sp. ASG 303]|uniref:universal stress protein n=1 Tax=Streptacidiphilus sp. ASG 303 TaxID=2896847 RepID=UPI001E48CD68|nr:universal stress protein [Streptacidiphilus sp. ASG 303]MCD0481142.1 universal stress protein [Streptacidiphilus sp. ASG 303]